jgi:ABC-2 type transport system ATP-binding protein
VLGHDVTKDPDVVRASIGLTGQFTAVDENLTGAEFLQMVGRLYHMAGHQAKVRAAELLKRFDLTDAANRTVKTYSGGMQRRLDLAASLVNRPKVLFLDEPTTGLDPQSRNALWIEVGRLAKEEGVTVFLTTQYLEEADVLADRVGIIDHGQIVAEGTPEELKAEIACSTVEAVPASPEQRGAVAAVLERFGEQTTGFGPGSVAVQLSSPNGELAEIVRALDAEGVHIAQLQIHEPTLDDVFLAKTGRHLEGAGEDEDEEEAGQAVAPGFPGGPFPRSVGGNRP